MRGYLPNGNVDLETNDDLYSLFQKERYFSADECNEIIKLSKTSPLVQATTGTGKDKKISKKIRKTEVKWFQPADDTIWVFDKLWKSINAVNRSYKYDIAGIEDMQVARYSNGGFYDWHLDIGSGIDSRRKLSVTIQLSKPEEYKGGSLQFFGNEFKTHFSPSKEIGTAIIFPSFLHHRVTSVTKGTRWSLVAWIIGPSFR